MIFFSKDKEKRATIALSLGIVFLISLLLYFHPPVFRKRIIELESSSYDGEVRRFHKKLSQHPSIVIVDVDDKSIAQEGRWPWNREKIARLTNELNRLGAKVIAFDMVFSEPQINPVAEVIQGIDTPELIEQLKTIQPLFDEDAKLEKAFSSGTMALGFALSANGKEEGSLPKPVLEGINQKTALVAMNGYIGNLSFLQSSGKNGGFINTTVDADGILRFSPLLLIEGGKIYPSLALEATKLFLSLPYSGIVLVNTLVESIQLGTISIPTDPWGRILIPFRGPPYSFPYLSAADLLNGKVNGNLVKDKLVFIGTTATGVSDLLATAISPVFPGVEVQATIASGIIDGYLPYKPHWGRALAIGLVIVLGTIAAFTFPFISMIGAFLLSLAIIAVLKGINYWLWTRHAIALSFFFPMPTLATIFIIDLISVHLSDKRRRQEMKRTFGQFIPPNYLDELLKNRQELTLEGSDREVSVLIVKIHRFSELTKHFSALEMSTFLHEYFTPITEAVFENRGVVDKYMRDQLLAFWGAPLPQADHPLCAVKAALAIQAKIGKLNRQLEKESKPPIRIAIGVNTGIASVGDMGSKYQRAYTVIGPTVETAASLQSLADETLTPILAGEKTRLSTEGKIRYQLLDPKRPGIYIPTSES